VDSEGEGLRGDLSPVRRGCALAGWGDVRKHYFAVRKYLNVHELMAVGIANGMFDDRTCVLVRRIVPVC
jgi:hypothetical protein